MKKSEDRKAEFIRLFRAFDSIAEGIKWVMQVTGVKETTVRFWKGNGSFGYTIPDKKWSQIKTAMDRDKDRFGFLKSKEI